MSFQPQGGTNGPDEATRISAVAPDQNLLRNTGLLAAVALLGQAVSFLFSTIIAASFGVGSDTDALFIAYTGPFVLLATLTVYYRPVLVSNLAKWRTAISTETYTRLTNVLLLLGAIVGLGVALLGLVGSPLLVSLLAPGFDSGARDLAVALARIVMPALLPIILTVILQSLLHAHGHFGAAALGTFVSSLAAVASILALRDSLGIQAASVARLIGYTAQVLFLAIACSQSGALRLQLGGRLPARKEISQLGREMIGATASLFSAQAIHLTPRMIGSFLPAGSITAFEIGIRIVGAATEICMGAIAAPSLPALASAIATQSQDKLEQATYRMLRLASFFAVPLAGALLSLSSSTIRVLYGYGKVGAADVRLLSSMLALLAVSVIPLGFLRAVRTVFYALGQVRALIRLAVVQAGMLIVSCALMAYLYKTQGLAIGSSLGSLVAAAAGLIMLARDPGTARLHWRHLVHYSGKLLLGTIAMGATMLTVEALVGHRLNGGGVVSSMLAFVVPAAAGAGILIISMYVLRIEELDGYIQLVRQRLKV